MKLKNILSKEIKNIMYKAAEETKKNKEVKKDERKGKKRN